MKNIFLRLLLFFFAMNVFAQKTDKVSVVSNEQGMKLVVNGEDFMINGMNWDYVPIGTNYAFSVVKQSDDVIKRARDS